MKKNKDIEKQYLSFIKNLTLLLKESDYYFHEKLEKIRIEKGGASKFEEALEQKQQNNIDNDLFKKELSEFLDSKREIQDLSKGIWLALNSNFIYCFALYESFQSKIIEIAFLKGGKFKKRYLQKFEEFAIKEVKEKGDDTYVRMLTTPKKTIQNYDSLPNPSAICDYVFDVNTKVKSYEQHKLRFIESKERRNLLIHRGTFADDRYLNTCKRYYSHKEKTIDKFLKSTMEMFCLRTSESEELGKTDLSITMPYMSQVFSALFYMSSLSYMSSYDLTKKEMLEKDSILPGYVLHDIMMLLEDKKFLNLALLLLDIWELYKGIHAKGKWENMPDIDKFNYILVYNFLFKLERIKRKDKPINEQEFRKIINPIFKSLSNNKETQILKNITENHIDNDVNKLIENINQLIEMGHYTKKEINSWFVIKKFKKNKKFMKMFNSL